MNVTNILLDRSAFVLGPKQGLGNVHAHRAMRRARSPDRCPAFLPVWSGINKTFFVLWKRVLALLCYYIVIYEISGIKLPKNYNNIVYCNSFWCNNCTTKSSYCASLTHRNINSSQSSNKYKLPKCMFYLSCVHIFKPQQTVMWQMADQKCGSKISSRHLLMKQRRSKSTRLLDILLNWSQTWKGLLAPQREAYLPWTPVGVSQRHC